MQRFRRCEGFSFRRCFSTDLACCLLALMTLLFCVVPEVATTITVLSNCSAVDKLFPAGPDITVNVSCTNLTFSNVVMNGNMTLNISGIVAANPGSNISVTIFNMTLQAGATLAIDSRGYTAHLPGESDRQTVSIMIQSLMSMDSCLLFLGSFPPRTTVLVSGARMSSSTVATPTLSALDPYFPSDHKMVMLVNVSLTGNSSMIFADSSYRKQSKHVRN